MVDLIMRIVQMRGSESWIQAPLAARPLIIMDTGLRNTVIQLHHSMLNHFHIILLFSKEHCNYLNLCWVVWSGHRRLHWNTLFAVLWLMLIFYKRKVLLAGWWLVLVWCERKILLASCSKQSESFFYVDVPSIWSSMLALTVWKLKWLEPAIREEGRVNVCVFKKFSRIRENKVYVLTITRHASFLTIEVTQVN